MTPLFCIVALLAASDMAVAYMTSYDQPFDFLCPKGQVLSYLASQHSNYYNDRVWDFACGSVPTSMLNCSKSGYVNEMDQILAFMCPAYAVVTGLESYHENFYEDRRFKFQCCELDMVELNECYMTDFTNKYDETFAYTVPAGYVVASSALTRTALKTGCGNCTSI
ncbi:dermatopontin-like isoform X2 [Physella acuta]|uniref:dermatopontin-like isoform X2 n=1 Tax=Physella acuta TaxID=109671 RepID=UPI0027DD9E3A|nr:dermatopontin-like isoform X2 [Physella acuta]